MRNFLKSWNFKKHIALVMSVYTMTFGAANGIMLALHFKKSKKEVIKSRRWMKHINPKAQNKAIAKSYFCEPSKPVRLVNGIIGACMLADVASYPLIKKLTKKL